MNEKPNYYAIIPANVRYDKELKDKAKLLYGEIVALSDKQGYCYASNKYFAELYEVSTTTISTLIKNLVEKGYIESEIIYKEGTKEILNRYLKIFKDPYLKKFKYPIKENLKDNNTSINNTSINNTLNEFKVYNVFEKKVSCECISKSTNEKCLRRATYNINGKNYCNQHSRGLIPDIQFIKRKSFTKPTIEEIKQYCDERNNSINAEAFYDFYESKDWYVGKNKMKDWKACIRTWERRNETKPKKKSIDEVFEEVRKKYESK